MDLSLESKLSYNTNRVITAKDKLSLYEIRDQALESPCTGRFLEALVPLSVEPFHLLTDFHCDFESTSGPERDGQHDEKAYLTKLEASGVDALTVNTCAVSSKHSLDDLRHVASLTDLPLLQRDVVVDEYQIWEARLFGANSITLYPSILDRAELQFFIEVTRELSMEPLLHCTTMTDIENALATDAKIIGVDHRPLKNTKTLGEINNLLVKHGGGRLIVNLYGVEGRYDVEKQLQNGYKAFLVDPSTKSSGDAEVFLRELSSKYF